jgi:hypothetical protein
MAGGQEWLGHAGPSFTLRTYVHLMNEGVGDAEFMDEAVGDRAPEAPESNRIRFPSRRD